MVVNWLAYRRPRCLAAAFTRWRQGPCSRHSAKSLPNCQVPSRCPSSPLRFPFLTTSLTTTSGTGQARQNRDSIGRLRPITSVRPLQVHTAKRILDQGCVPQSAKSTRRQELLLTYRPKPYVQASSLPGLHRTEAFPGQRRLTYR